MSTRPTLDTVAARRLLLAGADLLRDPAGPSGGDAVRDTIGRLGFVQVDAIAMSMRAHHHILASRHDDYEPDTLTTLIERDRALFEHWTHDASVIPVETYRPWQNRFRRVRGRGLAPNAWWTKRLGTNAARTVRVVLDRVREEGPVTAGELSADGRAAESGWWRWTPAKAALEYLWRAGAISIARRRDFVKVYDLAERVHPDHHELPPLTPTAHRDWACRAALDRLTVATPAELAAFFNAVKLPEATAWVRAAQRTGEVVPVDVLDADGTRRPAIAHHAWRSRLDDTPEPPDRARALSPFDPALRDRRRTERRFGFHYRFEAFVPAPKRVFGYYVLPVLDGDLLVARIDVRLDRPNRTLEILGQWWEPSVRVTAPLRRRVEAAIAVYAAQCGAAWWTPPSDS